MKAFLRELGYVLAYTVLIAAIIVPHNLITGHSMPLWEVALVGLFAVLTVRLVVDAWARRRQAREARRSKDHAES